jgi:hypothetical protein
MGVDGVTRSNTYTDAEIDRLRGHEGQTSDTSINTIGQHAGLTRHYTVRGDDKTEREIHAQHKGAQAADGASGVVGEVGGEVVDEVVELALEDTAIAGVGLLILPFSLLETGAHMVKNVAEDSRVGHERADALTKDAFHILIVGNVNGLPQGFAAAELSRYPESERSSTLVNTMAKRLADDGDHQAMAVIQLHADQGMNGAKDAIDSGVTRQACLKSNPTVAKRYAEDPAFKAGFDAMFWAKEKGGPGVYGATCFALANRDDGYVAHQVQCRV